MKQLQGISGIFMGGAAITLLATQPVWAAPTQVTAVQLTPTSSGLDVVLATQSGDRPQVFTVTRGNNWTADIINTQLRLREGNSFRQDNPAPGIAAVTVTPLDANSIRVTVVGQGASPAGQLAQRDANRLVLSLNSPAGTGTASTAPATPSAQAPVAQTPTTPAAPPAQAPLVPSPGITIEGTPVPPPRPNVAPPFLPRAVAPPVGDIAVSNIDVAPAAIDLGTGERVPRLVLRDAPAREVLALLARAAGLNLAFTEATPAAGPGATQTAPTTTANGPTISLDIENEPVQDVFNYILRLTGLEANRVGRTIFVGQDLPVAARGSAMRTLRLNQLKATMPLTQLTTTETSASSLTSGGGLGGSTTNSQVGRTSTFTQNVPVRGALQILEELGANGGGGATAGQPGQAATPAASQLLRGLQVTADSRTNSVTLIGSPNLIELATAHLVQLDVRRRQVAVNVKIVEVDLSNTDNIGASFSFGIADSFFNVNQGQLNANVGPFNPSFIQPSLTGQPTITNPLTGTPFIQPPRAPLGVADPFTPGVTEFTPGTPPTTTFEIQPLEVDPVTGQPTRFGLVPTVTPGTPDQFTYALPSLFQFPRQFLLNLQAQVQSGNAKILTDPTLIVQEGSQSQVNLTSQVFSGFTEVTEPVGNTTRTRIQPNAPVDVGVILNIEVDQIDDNGFVSLSLSPEVSSPGQQILDPSRNNLLIQQLVNRRRLETGNIRLRDGQTLVLTGIIQEQDRTITTKTPILGDIPLIGALFRSTSRQNSRNEVIVLVTPQIMDDSDRSAFGYNYTPSPATRQMLQRR